MEIERKVFPKLDNLKGFRCILGNKILLVRDYAMCYLVSEFELQSKTSICVSKKAQ